MPATAMPRADRHEPDLAPVAQLLRARGWAAIRFAWRGDRLHIAARDLADTDGVVAHCTLGAASLGALISGLGVSAAGGGAIDSRQWQNAATAAVCREGRDGCPSGSR